MPIEQAAAMLIGSGISAGGGIGSQFLGAHFDKKRDERANQFAIQQQNLANKQNIEFWNMQNQYNSPEQVMQRMRAAGLNPNLIYGQATPTAGTIAPAKAPQGQFTSQGNRPAQALGAIQESVNLAMQIKNMDLLDAEIRKKDAEAKYMGKKFEFDMLPWNEETWSYPKASEYQKSIQEKNNALILKNRIQRGQELKATTEKEYLETEKGKELYVNALEAKYRRIINQNEGENLINELRKLETDLNKFGITKNDPIYFRALSRIINLLIERGL
jgi:hypothetical protein